MYRACAGRQIVEQLLQALALAPRVAMPALGEVEVVPAQEEEVVVMMLEAVSERARLQWRRCLSRASIMPSCRGERRGARATVSTRLARTLSG